MLCELLPTLRALVIFYVIVRDTHVLFHVISVLERLVTLVTVVPEQGRHNIDIPTQYTLTFLIPENICV